MVRPKKKRITSFYKAFNASPFAPNKWQGHGNRFEPIIAITIYDSARTGDFDEVSGHYLMHLNKKNAYSHIASCY